MSTVIWVNSSLVNVSENEAFNKSAQWGIQDSVRILVEGEHTTGEFYVSDAQGEAEELVSTLERFLDRGVENDPDIRVVGDYRVIDRQYEVYGYEFEGLRIIWLMDAE